MVKPIDDARVAEACAQMLQRLRSAPEPWLSEDELRGGKRGALHKAAFERLRTDRRLVDLGRTQHAKVYGLAGSGQDDKQVAFCLATRHLNTMEQARVRLSNRLQPVPLKELHRDAAPKHLPSAVRDALLDALYARIRACQAFPLKIRNVDYFLFASDLRETLAVQTTPEADTPDPTTAPSAEACRSIREAYWALREQTGLRNVYISEIKQRTGVDLQTLHDYLNGERRAHRANATLGEPTAATPEQLAAAIRIEGHPHVYIELYE